MFTLTWCLVFYLAASCYAVDPPENTTEVPAHLDQVDDSGLIFQETIDAPENMTTGSVMQNENYTSVDYENRTSRQLVTGNSEYVTLYTGTYLFYLQTMDWADAHEFCRKKGMDLLAIESEEENAAVAEYGKILNFFTPWNGAWTSGCYHRLYADVSDYVWDSTGKNMQFTKWWPGYPKTRQDGYCIVFYPPDPRWWEESKSKSFPVICEL